MFLRGKAPPDNKDYDTLSCLKQHGSRKALSLLAFSLSRLILYDTCLPVSVFCVIFSRFSMSGV